MTDIEYIDKTCTNIQEFISSSETGATEETVKLISELKEAMKELAKQKENYERLYNECSLELENAKNKIEDMQNENIMLPKSDDDFLRGIEDDINCNEWQ